MEFIPLFFLAYLGGNLAQTYKLPAGQLLGSLLVTATITLTIAPVSYPLEVKFIARVLSGVLIGLRIQQKDLAMLKTIWKPLLFLVLGMILNATVLALLLTHFTTMDLTTALFACVPGGMADTTLMAEEYGADMSQVALIQLLRLLAIILVYPQLVQRISKKEGITPTTPIKKENKEPTPKKSPFHMDFPPISQEKISQAVRTFVFAGFGSLLFAHLNIPAGELLGAMTVTLVRHIQFHQGYFYPPLRSFIQVVVGIIIGSSVTPDSVAQLIRTLPISLTAVACILLFAVLLAKLLPKVYPTDPTTALLAVAPGGVQEMILLSDSLGGNVAFVTSLQVFRIFIVFSFFPLWISFLLSILSV